MTKKSSKTVLVMDREDRFPQVKWTFLNVGEALGIKEMFAADTYKVEELARLDDELL